MASSKLSAQQVEELKAKQLKNDDINHYFQLMRDGITDDNRAEYEVLRRAKVNLGDVADLYTGFDMQREQLLNQFNKELTIVEFILEDVVSEEQIKAATARYEDNYNKVNQAMEAKLKEQEEAKKAKKD